MSDVMVVFVLNCLRREAVIRTADICGIVDHHANLSIYFVINNKKKGPTQVIQLGNHYV